MARLEPRLEHRDVLAVLARTFKRLDERSAADLSRHAEMIGDDLEGWAILEHATTGAHVAQGILDAIASDIYTAGDSTPAKASVYAAAHVWLRAAHEALHRHGVLHRDLKPHNVLFDEEGAPRLEAELGATPAAAPSGDDPYMTGEAEERAHGG